MGTQVFEHTGEQKGQKAALLPQGIVPLPGVSDTAFLLFLFLKMIADIVFMFGFQKSEM